MRAVVDTNVLVSGLLAPAGSPGAIHAAWFRAEFELVTSGALFSAFVRVLSYPRIRRRLPLTDDELSDLVSQVRTAAVVVETVQEIAVVRDPDDNRVLEAAQAGFADYIVTGDRDLLELREFSGIPIVTPAAFLLLIATS